METKIINNLLATQEEFLGGLRDGTGFVQSSFEKFCNAIKEFSNWNRKSTSVPKVVMNSLVDVQPALTSLADLYSGEEKQLIEDKAIELSDLIRECAE